MAASRHNNASYGPKTDEMAVFGPFFLLMIAVMRGYVDWGKRIKVSWEGGTQSREGGMERGERG